ncbi:MAG: hypothetical protein PHT60_16520 [Acidiphilium sp.]|nr:hypothetical protein [Acidiphilium sp.]MDD4937369.1 hypothetical protein [Acidiphilium sp.]
MAGRIHLGRSRWVVRPIEAICTVGVCLARKSRRLLAGRQEGVVSAPKIPASVDTIMQSVAALQGASRFMIHAGEDEAAVTSRINAAGVAITGMEMIETLYEGRFLYLSGPHHGIELPTARHGAGHRARRHKRHSG